MKRWLSALLTVLALVCLVGCSSPEQSGGFDSAQSNVLVTESEEEQKTLQPTLTPETQGDAETVPESTDTAEVEEAPHDAQPNAPPEEQETTLPEDGSYTSRDDVALYIELYGRLPDNFITKKQAKDLGWPGGSLEPYAPGKCIGGDRFGNYEGLLPEKDGRSYTECDIDTLGASSRGAKRIVFSNDGLIYYTDDHYESFTLLYGEEPS
ncbi:MAG: ribonuclease domain-containing protein [Oscillospiraceae bacterium]|nr:ribonuclease domain-containing protein [Oscillospiraceae bacterium]